MPLLIDQLFKGGLSPLRKSGHRKEDSGVTLAEDLGSLSLALLQASSSTAKRSNSQRQMVQDIAAIEQNIQAAARQSASNSRQTAESTEAVARATERGNALMDSTTTAMQQMSQTARESASLMRQFVLGMADMSRVVETVRDIARQTNLLALNAAVEAAHAGKQGDGFTVIAHEIRALADRAGHSASEIAASITSMASTAHAAERAMQLGEEAADLSIQRNLEVEQALRSIRDSMQQVQTMSAEVAGASNRQIAAVEGLSTQIRQIDGMALESTYEADAAAEMSVVLVTSNARLGKRIGKRNPAERVKGRDERLSAEQMLIEISNCWPRVHPAIDLLRLQCDNAGPPHIAGGLELQGRKIPNLKFGAAAAADATVWVDHVNQKTGCVATVFVRDGADFVRVATNVKRGDGQRATGTVLNPRGMAIARLARKLPYEGVVYVLGKPFVAIYDPVMSSAGEVLGALYVGLSLDQ